MSKRPTIPKRTPTSANASVRAGVLSPARLTLRWIEFVLLYGGIPLLFLNRIVLLRWLIPFLVLTALVLGAVLVLDPSFERSRLANVAGARSNLRRIAIQFLIGAALLTGLTFLAAPARFFQLVRGNAGLYVIIMVAYPIFSVYPQEVIFRTFLFHRYRAIFRHPAVMVAASAAAFGWAHVFFDANLPVTLGLSTIGGAMFAWTYLRSRSTLACAIEHALYGDYLFTVGLGWYFYTGSVGG